MDWAQVGPLAGVVVGVVLKGLWDVVAQRQRDAREGRQRFMDHRLSATAEFYIAINRLQDGVQSLHPLADEDSEASNGTRDAVLDASDKHLDAMQRALFPIAVLCAPDVWRAADAWAAGVAELLGRRRKGDVEAEGKSPARLDAAFIDAVRRDLGMEAAWVRQGVTRG